LIFASLVKPSPKKFVHTVSVNKGASAGQDFPLVTTVGFSPQGPPLSSSDFFILWTQGTFFFCVFQGKFFPGSVLRPCLVPFAHVSSRCCAKPPDPCFTRRDLTFLHVPPFIGSPSFDPPSDRRCFSVNVTAQPVTATIFPFVFTLLTTRSPLIPHSPERRRSDCRLLLLFFLISLQNLQRHPPRVF